MRLDLYTGERERFLNFDFCFELTNCITGQTIIANGESVPEPLPEENRVIKLADHDGCWTIESQYGDACLVTTPVIVTQDYATCNDCLQYNYKLYNCIDDTVVYTNYLECPECYANIGNLVYTDLDPIPCWYVFRYYSTPSVITPVNINYELECDTCVPKCYTITGTGNVSYVTIGDTYIIETATAPVKICSYAYPIASGLDNEILVGENCNYRLECPIVCYELTNCDTDEVIYSYEQDLAFPYALNQTVKLAEFTGCWTIALVTCNEELPYVSTTVTQTFDSCTTCNPPNYYKLESCGTSQPLTVFTEQDLSAYIGQTVKMEEHPGCFNVTVFPSIYPSPSVVTIISSYDSCPECEAQRYILSDCDEIRPNIYTTTDLSAYVGQIVKLTFYPDTCWTVAETTINTSDDLVIVGDTYATCLECALTAPCICSTVTNNSTTTQTFGYLDCDNVYGSIILAAGEQSAQQCVLKWIFPGDWTLPKIITNCGDCVDGQCVVPKPIRSVRPGYNSPACTTQYYERIACAYSEILYRDVISQRYGIAPCCPEEEIMRLDIKFQLLELQAINNPDYLCAPTSNCCQRDNDCGCGCNS